MSQVFQVLCCYSCDIFQVHHVKKSKKWQCKVCCEKQSLKKAFKIGPAAECRSLVQELNMQRGMKKFNNFADLEDDSDEEYTETFDVSFEKENFENQVNAGPSLLEESCSENCLPHSECFEDSNEFFSSLEFDDLQKSKSAINGNNSLFQSVQNFESVHVDSSGNKELAKENITLGYDCLNILQETPKRQLEHVDHLKDSPRLSPPLKKNRGFEMIKKAASKLK